MSKPNPEPREITQLLLNWRGGDPAALDQLLPIVYRELHKLAAAYMQNERQGHTLQPTALVHETYLRLVDQSLPDFRSRAHFFGVAAQVMREVLVQFARRRCAQKRGSGKQVDLDEGTAATDSGLEDLLAVDEALDNLAHQDTRKAKVVEMRYFGGLTLAETAEALECSVATVKRDLAIGEAWLSRELANPGWHGL